MAELTELTKAPIDTRKVLLFIPGITKALTRVQLSKVPEVPPKALPPGGACALIVPVIEIDPPGDQLQLPFDAPVVKFSNPPVIARARLLFRGLFLPATTSDVMFVPTSGAEPPA